LQRYHTKCIIDPIYENPNFWPLPDLKGQRSPKGQMINPDIWHDLYNYQFKFGWATTNIKGTMAKKKNLHLLTYFKYKWGKGQIFWHSPILTNYGAKERLIAASGCDTGASNVNRRTFPRTYTHTYVRTEVSSISPMSTIIDGDNNVNPGYIGLIRSQGHYL
jgi:hypothetical protein